MSTPKKGDVKVGGVQAVADMFNAMDPESRARMLANLAERDPGLVEEIQRRIFVFEDLAKLEDLTLQSLLKEAKPKRLALALKKAPEEVKAALLRNLSARAAKFLLEEIEHLGPQRLSDVHAAQAEMAELAKRLLPKK